MALADSVPGVSGGTIAFLLGFYDAFIESLNDLVDRDSGRRKTTFLFLAKLGVGWVVGLCTSVLILSSLFEAHIYRVSSLFLELTLFTILMVIHEEREVLKGRYGNTVFALMGVLLVFCITCFNPSGGERVRVSVKHLSLGLAVYVLLIAMFAITAIMLPGISGSTLLLIFELYIPIIGAVKEFPHMDMDYFPILVVFGLSVVTGVVGVIKIIKMCLKRFRSQTIHTIIGLMTGSPYTITMGPTTLDIPRALVNPSTFSILFFILGGVTLAGLELLKARLDK